MPDCINLAQLSSECLKREEMSILLTQLTLLVFGSFVGFTVHTYASDGSGLTYYDLKYQYMYFEFLRLKKNL